WDFYLSSSLFSNKPPDLYICVTKNTMPKDLELYTLSEDKNFMCDKNSFFINVRTWSFKEIMVPAYPEKRVYKEIKKQLIERYPAMNGTFLIYEYKDGKKVRMELQ
ncbi:MAG: hypothetical protein ABIP35_03480, partial [Ginsengibacter sp.]